MPFKDAILNSLRTGFIDKSLQSSNKAYRPELITNDLEKGKIVLNTIIHELEQCEEFWFSVAFITTGGVATIINTLFEIERKEIKGQILASQYLNFTQPEALKRIKQFKNIEIRIATEGANHAKGYLFKKRDGSRNLIVGSSNLTASALKVNKEWNLKISAGEDSELIYKALDEFQKEFASSQEVTDQYLIDYGRLWEAKANFEQQIIERRQEAENIQIRPNLMQREALLNIQSLRSEGKKKALLISATGTGKTYLSAFDVQVFKPKTFLFIVHRLTIALEAMKTFRSLLGGEIKMGIFSGNNQDIEADYVFSTIQTISKKEHLGRFTPNHFDYIVIDETHRAGADSYKRIMDYFTPKFLLGMTATPERTDGADIFKMFNYNIAYEIRLHQALSEGMLSPFHYYGVTDLTINNQEVDEFTDFNLLTSNERVDRIIEAALRYGCDLGVLRGLVFCSRNEIAVELSYAFNNRGYRTVALSGLSSEQERQRAIDQLESDDISEKLDYIFTVDIFNEGIDIPKVNQIIMLRPTQSAIIFVQQLGRGLRKTSNKQYLTVIDFIGNYSNNYLVPIALYGDISYNKDTLRKLMASGSCFIPGTSTINFDQISRKRIFESIDSANMQLKRDLINDYNLLKFRLGKIPMMTDFSKHGSRDPQLYINYSKSYFNFVVELEDSLKSKLGHEEKKLLELFSNEINNSKRIEESLILKNIIQFGSVSIKMLREQIEDEYGYSVSDATINSCINNLNFKFIKENNKGRLVSVHELYGINVVSKEKEYIVIETGFLNKLNNSTFRIFLEDSIDYSILEFKRLYKKNNFIEGFVLYRKYSRKDVFRILNWDSNPIAQNVGGYIISPDKTNCPIFVNYHKEENISNTIKYEDGFISNSVFEWMSKSKRTLKSPDVVAIKNYKGGLRLPLFIKKHNDEGKDFYYMGEITPIEDSFAQATIPDDRGNPVSVVKIKFIMNHPVEDSLYNYLTSKGDENSNDILSEVDSNDSRELYPFKAISKVNVRPFINCIPLYDIRASAGKFSDLQLNTETTWIELNRPFKYSEDYFVCKVEGESMNKIIPNNSWCLFKRDTGGTREGKVVLVRQTSIHDPDYASGFTIKLYESKKMLSEESWLHDSIILKPKSTNPEFKEIVLSEDDLLEFRVEGIFIEVLI